MEDVEDTRPPVTAARLTNPFPPGIDDEVELFLAYLDMYREVMLRKIEGLTEEQARWTPTASANSLLTLIYHLAGVETRWAQSFIAGRDAATDRDAEFGDKEGVTIADAVERYRAAAWATNEVVRDLGSLDAPCSGDTTRNVRWVLLHLLDETARHAGHADITRELIDGTTGF